MEDFDSLNESLILQFYKAERALMLADRDGTDIRPTLAFLEERSARLKRFFAPKRRGNVFLLQRRGLRFTIARDERGRISSLYVSPLPFRPIEELNALRGGTPRHSAGVSFLR